jgi:hypothetical protein
MTWVYDHTQKNEPAAKAPLICDYLEAFGHTGVSSFAPQYDTLPHDPATDDWLERVVSTPPVGTLSARQAIAVALADAIERRLGNTILQEADGAILVL